MLLPEDPQTLLSRVPADGSSIGNIRSRESLGREEGRFAAACQPSSGSGQSMSSLRVPVAGECRCK
jgi:hypothetical protein